LRKLPGYEEVPLLRELASGADQQAVFDFISKAVVVARPIVAAAGVPSDRVAALRAAFDATMADSEFRREAERQGLEISPMGGEELAKIIADMLDTPPALLARIAKAIEIKALEPAKGVKPGGSAE
jgi:hypothetical protein